MATMKPNTPAAPEMGEIAPPDNPYAPFERRSYAAAVSYTSMLVPSDTVLQSHGGIDNLRIYRELLRDAMEAEGFRVYEFEWWHFDYGDWRKYPIGNLTFDRIR